MTVGCKPTKAEPSLTGDARLEFLRNSETGEKHTSSATECQHSKRVFSAHARSCHAVNLQTARSPHTIVTIRSHLIASLVPWDGAVAVRIGSRF